MVNNSSRASWAERSRPIPGQDSSFDVSDISGTLAMGQVIGRKLQKSKAQMHVSTLSLGQATVMCTAMAESPDSAFDHLWKEYSVAFREFDDLTLARWSCQTLGQLQERAWRLSHPLLGSYRLAAQEAHERQIWQKRLATIPMAYSAAPCCGAPLLPLLTRDIVDAGLVCVHCAETCVPFEDLAEEIRAHLSAWAEEYAPVHAVAHWDDLKRKSCGNYDRKFEEAACHAEQLLSKAGKELVPLILSDYPTIVWEDQDDCLEVSPEDIIL